MSPRTILLSILLLTAVGETVLGTLWLRDLKQLEAGMLHADERMTLNAQLSAAETRAGTAKKRLDAALNAPLESTGGATIGALAGHPAGGSEFSRRFHEALGNSEFKSKLAEAQKARLGQEYGPLFAQLGLKGDQLDKLQNLLVEKQVAKSESGPLEVYDTEIQAAIGDQAYAKYVQYEDTSRLHAAVNKFAAGLNATDSPLSADTANQLVEQWYNALPPESKGHPTGLSAEVGAGLAPDYELPALPANAEQIAQGLLSAPQLQAFERLIKAQAAQTKLRAQE